MSTTQYLKRKPIEYRFLVVMYRAGASDTEVGPALVRTRDFEKFYHEDQPSYILMPRSEFRVLADYGMADMNNEEAIEALRVRFILDYRVGKPELRADSAGWLSPEGEFYPCEYYEHDWLAYNLYVCINKELPHYISVVNWLEKQGWCRVGLRSVFIGEANKEVPPTQRQEATLREILAYSKNEVFRTAIDNFLYDYVEGIA